MYQELSNLCTYLIMFVSQFTAILKTYIKWILTALAFIQISSLEVFNYKPLKILCFCFYSYYKQLIQFCQIWANTMILNVPSSLNVCTLLYRENLSCDLGDDIIYTRSSWLWCIFSSQTFHCRIFHSFCKGRAKSTADAVLMTECFIPNFCPMGLDAKLRRQYNASKRVSSDRQCHPLTFIEHILYDESGELHKS